MYVPVLGLQVNQVTIPDGLNGCDLLPALKVRLLAGQLLPFPESPPDESARTCDAEQTKNVVHLRQGDFRNRLPSEFRLPRGIVGFDAVRITLALQVLNHPVPHWTFTLRARHLTARSVFVRHGPFAV